MRRTLIIIMLFAVLTLHAQHAVRGMIYDNTTRQPLDFVNVEIVQGDKVIDGATTDSKGAYSINIKQPGNYIVRANFIGYKEVTKNITVKGEVTNVGKLYIEEDSQQLGEVEVVGQGSTMRFELDKKVFTVDQNLAAAGGSATEALENIPSVDVDHEGNISLRNSESVEIWINGKPQGLTEENRAQILQQLPAESIKEIELITNPSAKYNPEGTAGIINIVLKKDGRAGYYGSLAAGISYPEGAAAPGWNVNGAINFTKGIVDAYFNIGYRQFRMANRMNSDRYNYREQDTLWLGQNGKGDRKSGGLFLRGGVNLRLGERSTLGIGAFGVVADRSIGTSTNHYTQKIMGEEEPLLQYDREETQKGKRPNYSVNIDYALRIDRRQDLQLSASYRNHSSDEDKEYRQTYLIGDFDDEYELQNQFRKNGKWEFKADYTFKITQNRRLEAGWNTTLQDQRSGADAKDDAGNELPYFYNRFDYKEQIHALYVTYGDRFWDRLSLQVGFRGEYMRRDTKSDGTANPMKDYWQWFPSAYLSYSFPQGHELQANYTRRIDRPRGRQIDPYKNLADPENVTFGNADLMPQYTSSVELNYLKTWEKHTLSAGFFYKYTDDCIQQVRYFNDELNRMEATYSNMGKKQDAGLEVVWKGRFSTWLQITLSANGYWQRLHAGDFTFDDKYPIHIKGQQTWAGSAKLNANFMFTKTFTGQLTARYDSPTLVAQGKRAQSYAIDLGLRKTFLNRQLALAFNVRDLLDSRNRIQEKWGENFYQKTDRRWRGRSYNMTLTWSFGNMKSKSKKDNDSGNRGQDDEGGAMDDFEE